ncbi:hypothetical protein [Pinisolibacter aquiterrae]|uniref:hypothetical protein n=1 Tax=Pinisolibacter aquiterrae TaxID=2815579 RepID=UPI001C3D9610|nr:hypothetical protein [Pinisolibacter aquiterrae]MBV5264105.1 hypothetical protein [Pinisolibacter aquiterrae]MCC8233800.1 hypothetical protein [Pinisolibacter aquiterrae]
MTTRPRPTPTASKIAALALAFGLIGVGPGLAQGTGQPMPLAPAPAEPLGYAPNPAPSAAPHGAAAATTAPMAVDVARAFKATLKLSALVTEGSPAIHNGLVWRIFQEKNNSDDKLQLIVTASGGDAEFDLEPGSYLVHAAYGRAGATTRVTVTKDATRKETLILNAGGLKLQALGAGDLPLPADKLTFDVYSMESDQRGDRQALVMGVGPGKIIRLNADTYRVVGHYGDLNAVVRAEIHVNPGKLTEATVYHKAAQLTLKLVNEPGGEALTNTSWLVLTPSGDPITESVGAFPTIVLAEGDYALVAKNQDRIFTRNFTVQAGYDREIEIVADEKAKN